MLDVHTTSGKRFQLDPEPVYEAWSLVGARFTLVGTNDHVDRLDRTEAVTVSSSDCQWGR